MAQSKLYYGDNLDVMRQHIRDESVDMVYLDPPFNSNRNYNVIFDRHAKQQDAEAAQIQAFSDTWVWTPETDDQYTDYVNGGLPVEVAEALMAFRSLLGENDAMAYLVNMAPRLVELHRVLKPTGTLWLHCDPTMSHYLKILLDTIFGPTHFRNEVVWRRTPFKGSSKARAQQMPKSHDVIFFYSKGTSWTWKTPSTGYSDEYLARFKWDDGDGKGPYRKTSLKTYSEATLERLREADELILPKRAGAGYSYKQYLNKSSGQSQLDDVWVDINMLNPQAKERLGYPTQKPLALLDRIIEASTNEGDVVFDPFCGCGTTVDSAQRLNRPWLGIDITYIAIDLIEKRLEDTYGAAVKKSYEVLGIPRDVAGAQALFKHSPFDLERWAVTLINGQPNQRQVGDRGIDGVARFPLNRRDFGRILISVKGGKNVHPDFVRDLLGTVTTNKAEMGVLILMGNPTRGIIDAVNHAGNYTHPGSNQKFPRIQVISIPELLAGKRPKMPPTVNPYISAIRRTATDNTSPLFEM